VCVCVHAIIEQETHQEIRYPNVTSLYFATPLAFNTPDGGVPQGQSPKTFCTELNGWLMTNYKIYKIGLLPKVSTPD